MIDLNLLPWREQRQEERRKHYLASLVALVLLLIVVAVGVHVYFNAKISHQKSRNSYLNRQVQAYQRQIFKISKLKETQKSLTSRLKVIQNLQANRPYIVKLFNGLVKIIPNGIYIDSIISNEKQLMINGYGESNNHIAILMRNVHASKLVTKPRLVRVGSSGSVFKRNFELSMQKQSK